MKDHADRFAGERFGCGDGVYGGVFPVCIPVLFGKIEETTKFFVASRVVARRGSVYESLRTACYRNSIHETTHLSLSIEMKCFPSNPAKAEIDMVRLTYPFLINASAPRRTAGWLRNRRPDESIIFAKVVLFVAWFSSFMRTRGSDGYEDCCRGDVENALDPELS